MQNGKGDTYRPVNQKAWDENYERIFGKKKAKPKARKKNVRDNNQS